MRTVVDVSSHDRLFKIERTLLQCTESASLLGRLIHNAPQLVLPYVSPIEKALVGKLRTAAQHAPLLADPSGSIALPKGSAAGEG